MGIKLWGSFLISGIAMMLIQSIGSAFFEVEWTMNRKGIVALVGAIVLLVSLFAQMTPEDYQSPATTCPNCKRATLQLVQCDMPTDWNTEYLWVCHVCGHTTNSP